MGEKKNTRREGAGGAEEKPVSSAVLSSGRYSPVVHFSPFPSSAPFSSRGI